jgi:hypothetical protein
LQRLAAWREARTSHLQLVHVQYGNLLLHHEAVLHEAQRRRRRRGRRGARLGGLGRRGVRKQVARLGRRRVALPHALLRRPRRGAVHGLHVAARAAASVSRALLERLHDGSGAHRLSVCMTQATRSAVSAPASANCSCTPVALCWAKGASAASVAGSASYAAATARSAAVPPAFLAPPLA